MKFVMKCGHTSNAKNESGEIICGICDCKEVLSICQDDILKGRRAVCCQHKDGKPNTPIPSRWDLPFFRYRPDAEYDNYYCGCYGWD